MGGFFCGVLEKGNRSKRSKNECVRDVFYGIDYHSHLGTSTGGMSVWVEDINDFSTKIQDISKKQFRNELMEFEEETSGRVALGSISDFEPQPLTFSLKFGRVAIAHVGKMNNLEELVKELNPKHALSTMSKDGVNPIEIIAELINKGKTMEDGIEIAQNNINGSCSLMIATADSVYLARDNFGRTPIFVGHKPGIFAAALEPSSFSNQGFSSILGLKAGEIGRLNSNGYERLRAGSDENLQLCSFLYVYYGFPASFYEGKNVEIFRNKNGKNHGERNQDREKKRIDFVAGIPDSGTGHAIGYAQGAGLPYLRPFIKYAQTWQRSFMPSEQEQRDHVAQKKLIAIPDLIRGNRILFTEDSIVRGTQLIARTEELKSCGVSEVHMRPSCPPLVYSCGFLNFSRSKGSHELAGIRAIKKLKGKEFLSEDDIIPYSQEGSEAYLSMIEQIRRDIPHLTSLDYQRLPSMVEAIGLEKSKLCTHCFDGSSYCAGCPKK